jgi:hypothetical protein
MHLTLKLETTNQPPAISAAAEQDRRLDRYHNERP